MIHRFIKLVVVCSFFSSIPQIQAPAQGKNHNLNYHLDYFLFFHAMPLSRFAFDWILAQLNLLNVDPNMIPVNPWDKAQAQTALNDFLTGRERIEGSFNDDYEYLEQLSWDTLIKIVLDPAAPRELKFVARLVLNRKHIRPAFENDDFETIKKIHKRIIQRGMRLGLAKDRLRNLLKELSPPNRKRSSQGGIQESIARVQDKRQRVRAFDRWTKENRFSERLNSVLATYAHSGSVHEIVQLEILNLQEKLEKARNEKNASDFIEYHVQILELVALFESFPEEDDPFEVEMEATVSPHQAIQNAMKESAGTRFEANDPILHAQVMGFIEDHEAMKAAEAQDRTPDNQHRLSKGGNNRFIRGDLIISVDRDGHAGGAYKLFVKKNSGWFYEDTAIPVEINGSWMLLLLNRKKNALSTYWYLVDETGKWWRLRKDNKDAVLEEIDFSNFVPPSLSTKRTRERDN